MVIYLQLQKATHSAVVMVIYPLLVLVQMATALLPSTIHSGYFAIT